jgi:hypothetical protein
MCWLTTAARSFSAFERTSSLLFLLILEKNNSIGIHVKFTGKYTGREDLGTHN